ncbi:hypothetical protein BC936DRAFT_145859 [Jimgerdemannia flammicorona]|uniref:Uncharacterized protein n=1 Tax=Jimgerdemannia flammicorona TaxID=994334 RepID=A0A433D925_9FUNG|nr:hypothetical protein BC936DRAFT_145859 [Jimgerdemannia flammicorona]
MGALHFVGNSLYMDQVICVTKFHGSLYRLDLFLAPDSSKTISVQGRNMNEIATELENDISNDGECLDGVNDRRPQNEGETCDHDGYQTAEEGDNAKDYAYNLGDQNQKPNKKKD